MINFQKKNIITLRKINLSGKRWFLNNYHNFVYKQYQLPQLAFKKAYIDYKIKVNKKVIVILVIIVLKIIISMKLDKKYLKIAF